MHNIPFSITRAACIYVFNWGEHGNGFRSWHMCPALNPRILHEWRLHEQIADDHIAHVSIVGWCPHRGQLPVNIGGWIILFCLNYICRSRDMIATAVRFVYFERNVVASLSDVAPLDTRSRGSVRSHGPANVQRKADSARG